MHDEDVIEIAQATDLEIRALFNSVLSEIRKRKMDISRSVRDMPWFQKERVDESEDSEDEEEDIDASDDGVDYSLQDESEDFYDDDDWMYDEPMSGRTPNDDRSDSMNPNSHRYNPGK